MIAYQQPDREKLESAIERKGWKLGIFWHWTKQYSSKSYIYHFIDLGNVFFQNSPFDLLDYEANLYFFQQDIKIGN